MPSLGILKTFLSLPIYWLNERAHCLKNPINSKWSVIHIQNSELFYFENKFQFFQFLGYFAVSGYDNFFEVNCRMKIRLIYTEQKLNSSRPWNSTITSTVLFTLDFDKIFAKWYHWSALHPKDFQQVSCVFLIRH